MLPSPRLGLPWRFCKPLQLSFSSFKSAGHLLYTWGWKLPPSPRPRTRKLPEGHNYLLLEAFLISTKLERFEENLPSLLKGLSIVPTCHCSDRRRSDFSFANYLLLILAGRAKSLGDSSGYCFLIALFCALLGTYVGAKIIERLDPKTSWTKTSLQVAFSLVATGVHLLSLTTDHIWSLYGVFA